MLTVTSGSVVKYEKKYYSIVFGRIVARHARYYFVYSFEFPYCVSWRKEDETNLFLKIMNENYLKVNNDNYLAKIFCQYLDNLFHKINCKSIFHHEFAWLHRDVNKNHATCTATKGCIHIVSNSEHFIFGNRQCQYHLWNILKFKRIYSLIVYIFFIKSWEILDTFSV